MAGTAKWCAWNAGFDKAAWNYGTVGFPVLEPEHIIDAMVQATVSGLPPSLKMAAKFADCANKVEGGTELIKLFCHPESTATPKSHPEEWQLFLEYAVGDITAMREIFRATRQLPLAEWKEYWAMERINERGVAIDLAMVKHATWLAHEDKRRSSALLQQLTGGAVRTVDQVSALTKWLLGRMPPEGREILLKREEEVEEDGTVVRPAKYTLTRQKVERLIAYAAAGCLRYRPDVGAPDPALRRLEGAGQVRQDGEPAHRRRPARPVRLRRRAADRPCFKQRSPGP